MASASIRQQFNWGKDGGGTIPLIIIDDIVQIDPATNLPTMDKFNMLDLSEVESITVLRDASAAIYGARASQGAIVVKTKRGKLGSPKITYSGKFEMNDAVSHSEVMNAKEYGLFSNRLNRAAAASQQNFFYTHRVISYG
jgi:TonB-dependent SusC/RagA subfamily outer membrane receptor